MQLQPLHHKGYFPLALYGHSTLDYAVPRSWTLLSPPLVAHELLVALSNQYCGHPAVITMVEYSFIPNYTLAFTVGTSTVAEITLWLFRKSMNMQTTPPTTTTTMQYNHPNKQTLPQCLHPVYLAKVVACQSFHRLIT